MSQEQALNEQDVAETLAGFKKAIDEATESHSEPSESKRISKKTGKEVRPLNKYQEFAQAKLKERGEDGKRKFTMKQVSELWQEHKKSNQ